MLDTLLTSWSTFHSGLHRKIGEFDPRHGDMLFDTIIIWPCPSWRIVSVLLAGQYPVGRGKSGENRVHGDPGEFEAVLRHVKEFFGVVELAVRR